MNRKLQVLGGAFSSTPALLALLVVSTMMGCGTPGAPEPPSLDLPAPVGNLSAARTGGSVHLAWTMPTRTTDHVALKHPITVEVCRAIENIPCANIASFTLAPDAAGVYADELPATLAQGPDRLLRYEVVLQNHAGKSAGPSNAAYSAAGPCPPALIGLSGQVRREGVLLSWQAVPEPGRPVLFRIERRLLTTTAPAEAARSPLGPSAPAVDQTLVVHGRDGSDPGHALDNSALFGQQYQYLVQRAATLTLAGQSVKVQGPPSETIIVSTKDTFPPAVPQGLVAVADAADGAIDLSWTPDSDIDLAAYYVYRREVHGSLPAQRIASVGTETSLRDTGAQPEHTYAYSVSAIDQSGNESKQSDEVEETLPAH
jgi:hypothetical protein